MKNRKRAETYRFNGSPHLVEKSIRSVSIDDLVIEIGKFRRKLDDPKDKDDKRWTRRWLTRYEKELAKKRRGLADHQRQALSSRPRRRARPHDEL